MSDSCIKALAAKIRNIFTTAQFSSRNDDGSVKIQTSFGRVIDNVAESFPYGFKSKAEKGEVTVLCSGGSLDAVKILPVESVESAPDLNDGDTAVYSSGGSFVVCRKDGTVELDGKNFGGLVKADELKAQLDKNNQILQTIKNIASVPVNEPGNGSPSAFQAALSAALSTLQTGDFSQIKSDKVLHGNG